MERPDPPYEGTCLCGAVKIKVAAPPLLTLACHCRDCQKLCASAFSLTTMFPQEGFSCTGELMKGGLRSDGRTHYYCKSCLNFVFSQIGGDITRINLRTSVLSNAASFEPFVELMTDEKMPWVDIPTAHNFAKYPENPNELQALMDEYCAL